MKYLKNLNSTKWLKEYADYEKEKEDGVTIHRISPDCYEISEDYLTNMEGAFLDEDDYDELMDSLKEDGKDVLDEIQFDLAFGIRSGHLVSLTLEIDDDGEMEVEFTDIGKTKFDYDDLQDFLDEAKENA